MTGLPDTREALTKRDALLPIWNEVGWDAEDRIPNQKVCGEVEGLFTVVANDLVWSDNKETPVA